VCISKHACFGLFVARTGCLSVWLSILLLSLLAMAIGPLAAAFSDSCNLVHDLPADLGLYLRPGLEALLDDTTSPSSVLSNAPESGLDASSISNNVSVDAMLGALRSCLEEDAHGVSLSESLNLQAQFTSYLEQVDLNLLDNGEGFFNATTFFADFYSMRDKVATITPQSFGIHPQNISAAAQICASCTGWATSGNSQHSDCENQCDDPLLGAACEEARERVCAASANMTKAHDYILNTSAAIRTMFDAVEVKIEGLVLSAAALVTALNETSDSMRPYLDEVVALEFGRCGFVAAAYTNVTGGICGSPSLLLGALWLYISISVVGLVCVGVIVTMMYVNCRCGGVGQEGHNHVKEIRTTLSRTLSQGAHSASGFLERLSGGGKGWKTSRYAPRETELPGWTGNNPKYVDAVVVEPSASYHDERYP